MAEPVKKWTDYYGGLRHVTMQQDSEGKFTGYTYCGAGTNWSEPVGMLSEDCYWDTPEEALAGMQAKLVRLIAEQEAIKTYLAKKQTEAQNLIQHLSGALAKVRGAKPEDGKPDGTITTW